jgi:hypothetical protein
MKPDQTLCFDEVRCFLESLFNGDLHAKRVLSLANATLGVVTTASLAVDTIGQGLARLRGFGVFLMLRPLPINGLAGKVCTTAGSWGRWLWRSAVAAVVATGA